MLASNPSIETYVQLVSLSPYPQPLCINSSAVIECNITLNTAIGPDLSVINYYWYHNDSLIEDSNITTTDNGTVFITQISISLPGTYTCKANITGSGQTKNASLDVKVKGTIL